MTSLAFGAMARCLEASKREVSGNARDTDRRSLRLMFDPVHVDGREEAAARSHLPIDVRKATGRECQRVSAVLWCLLVRKGGCEVVRCEVGGGNVFGGKVVRWERGSVGAW